MEQGESVKKRKLRFWVAQSLGGNLLTAPNKKLLREKVESHEDNFKGTKIRLLEVEYVDHSDLAAKLLGASAESLLLATSYVKVMSEYDA